MSEKSSYKKKVYYGKIWKKINEGGKKFDNVIFNKISLTARSKAIAWNQRQSPMAEYVV